jgi:DNA relaxase NicK
MNDYTELRLLDKVVLIDYLTVNIDDFRVIKQGRNDYRIMDERFNELVKVLGFIPESNNMQPQVFNRGFTNGYLLNQFIRIHYGGEQVKSHGRYTVSIEMSGQACREFEKYSGHTWLDLFRMIFKYESFRISRLDFAIDDFKGSEISLPYIRDLVEKGLYTSNSRKGSAVSSWEKNSDEVTTAGLTIYIGAKGGNQLAIYDKLRERIGLGLEVETDCWNRYEMRFVHEKAYAVLEYYYLALETNNDYDLKQYVQGLLRDFMDLKDENDKNSRIRRKETNPKWLDFLESIHKIDIKRRVKEPPTFQRKLKWIDESMGSTFVELVLAKDLHGLQELIYRKVLDSIDDLEPKKLARLNQYLIETEQDQISDDRIEQVKKLIKRILGDDE